MGIAENIANIKNNLPPDVCLVAVSKTKPIEMLMEAYNSGHKDLGENKVQELLAKYEALPKDINWHFIGHLQSNKVKYIAPFIHLLHGVDSIKLLKTISKEGLKNDRVIQCLLQIKIAEEDSKFGLAPHQVRELISSDVLNNLPGVKVVGLMGMATNTENIDKIKSEFASLKSLFDKLKGTPFLPDFNIISMGMSGDFKEAIACGSNMIRIGSSIFGQRFYP